MASSSPASSSWTRLNAFRCASLQNPRTQNVFQSIVKGRKSWKTLRGGEVVWPPELEAALIEGLENYQPDDSRETRLLGRFPMRNRFISDWIFEKTGKRRTAKQVGSRLQQLRDTCGGKRYVVATVLDLLLPKRHLDRTPSPPDFPKKDDHVLYGTPAHCCEYKTYNGFSASSSPTPTEAHATLQNLLYRGVEPWIEETPETIVYIDLLAEQDPTMDISGAGSDDGLSSNPSWMTSPSQIAEERTWMDRGYKVVRASQHPRHLRDIDPTITLLSRLPTSSLSYFTVYTDDGLISSETTELEPLESASMSTDDAYLYRTPLVPSFWDTIANSSDASKFVIVQRVVQDASSSSVSSPTIFSAMYRFNYVTSSSAMDNSYQAPQLLQIENPMHKPEFQFDSLLTMDTEFPELNGMYQKAPNNNLFDVNYAMRADWSSAPSSSSSVYPSPVDCSRPPMPGIQMSEDQLISPTFSISDISQYSQA